MLNARTLQKYAMFVRIANQAHHFEDVKFYLTKLIEYREQIAEDFTTHERYLISVGYKNYIGELQVAARTVTLIYKNPKYQQRFKLVLSRYKREMHNRLKTEAIEIANLMKGKAYKIA